MGASNLNARLAALESRSSNAGGVIVVSGPMPAGVDSAPFDQQARAAWERGHGRAVPQDHRLLRIVLVGGKSAEASSDVN